MKNSAMAYSSVKIFVDNTFPERLRLWAGAMRRLIRIVFQPQSVRENLARRQGECLRCGACCQMGSRCNYFRDDEGIPYCALYDRYRPPNCRLFPIDETDLSDRNLVAPDRPCGFWWATDDDANRK